MNDHHEDLKHHPQLPPINLPKIEAGIQLVLEGIGASPFDPNFIGTPARVARMYQELLSPALNNWASFPAKSTEMILLRNHRVFALCPHHLLPVDFRAFVGYIPQHKILGLSKLARVVEECLTTPILQEDLTNQIADFLWDKVSPLGVGVLLVGVHGCMRYRGVETEGDVVTSALRGVLLKEPEARAEFLNLVGIL